MNAPPPQSQICSTAEQVGTLWEDKLPAPYVLKVLSAWARCLRRVQPTCGRLEATECANTWRQAKTRPPLHMMAPVFIKTTNVTMDNSQSEVTTPVLTVQLVINVM